MRKYRLIEYCASCFVRVTHTGTNGILPWFLDLLCSNCTARYDHALCPRKPREVRKGQLFLRMFCCLHAFVLTIPAVLCWMCCRPAAFKHMETLRILCS